MMGEAASEIVTGRLARDASVESGLRLFSSWLTAQMEFRGLPGASVAVVHDQQLVWCRGFGFADPAAGIPAGPDTLYRIASISKLFTATAVMQLRDRGLVSLDEPVETYLPGFRLRRHPDEDEPITLRRILTHTSGLPREAAFPYWSQEDCFPSAEEILEALPGQEAVHAPARRWKYSNLALSLAGEVVSRVAGMPFESYVQRRILRPLGMRSSGIGLPDPLAGMAVGFGRRMPDGTRELRPRISIRGLDAAGGLYSSARDLAQFAMLQLRNGPEGGRQVLKGSSLREMHRVQWLRPDWRGGWGIGFSVVHQTERDLVGHGGWLAGFQSAFAVSLGEKTAAIVLTNADDAWPYVNHPMSITDRLLQWVAPALVRATTPKPRPQATEPAWAGCVGRYRSAWGDVEVILHEGRLKALSPTDLDPTPGMVELAPVGDGTFRSKSDAPFGEDGDPVRFEFGADGRAQRIVWGENAKERLGD